jgi:circadian clock protein KaiC
MAVSSIVDTWLLVKSIENNGERNRGLYVLKSRGMPHSNQIREFLITSHGVELVDVYVGAGGVLTGSGRQQQEARERAEFLTRQQELAKQRRLLESKRRALEGQITSLRAEFEQASVDLELTISHSEDREQRLNQDREEMATSRGQRAQNGSARRQERARS